jgi:pyruvate kinase
MVEKVDAMLRDEGLVQTGDHLVILAGIPPTQQGTTNLLRLHRAGSTT